PATVAVTPPMVITPSTTPRHPYPTSASLPGATASSFAGTTGSAPLTLILAACRSDLEASSSRATRPAASVTRAEWYAAGRLRIASPGPHLGHAASRLLDPSGRTPHRHSGEFAGDPGRQCPTRSRRGDSFDENRC